MVEQPAASFAELLKQLRLMGSEAREIGGAVNVRGGDLNVRDQ